VITLILAMPVIVAVVSFTLSVYVAEYFIIDRAAGVLESIRLSWRYMSRNRLGLASALIMTGIAAFAATFVTCGLASVMVPPYFALLSAAYYLAATGQLELPDK
jgi:tetrahydromethanopterin S-methyltransferase subunit F